MWQAHFVLTAEQGPNAHAACHLQHFGIALRTTFVAPVLPFYLVRLMQRHESNCESAYVICRRGQQNEAQMRMLHAPISSPTAALAWQPSGYLIATATSSAPGLVIWDVASGRHTPLSTGRYPDFPHSTSETIGQQIICQWSAHLLCHGRLLMTRRPLHCQSIFTNCVPAGLCVSSPMLAQ